MHTVTLHGNITGDPISRTTSTGTAVLNFGIAANGRRYDRANGGWVDQTPVFHRVVAFQKLAENAAATLAKGMAVVVTGEFTDASYYSNSGQYVRGMVLRAIDIGPSLRFATATVVKAERRRDEATGQTTEDAGDQADDVEVSDRTDEVPAA